jgi:aminoglycoside phosphotransferase (APT) family kinase protein
MGFWNKSCQIFKSLCDNATQSVRQSRDDYVARYCARTGRAEGIANFHLAFACFRFAVIFEGIAKRTQIGTAAGADAEQVGRLSIDYARCSSA